MLVQAGGIFLTVLVPTYPAWLAGAVLQGLGTAMVYPTLLAVIGDVAHPSWRATSYGVSLARDLSGHGHTDRGEAVMATDDGPQVTARTAMN
jgi:MFS family permease